MHITTIKLPKVRQGDDLFTLVTDHCQGIEERSIIAISSKIVSLCEGRVIPHDQVEDKLALVKQEADAYWEEDGGEYGITLTMKDGLLVPAAGIDESNSRDGYVLYPKDGMGSAAKLWQSLRRHYKVGSCGVLITDSVVLPLRRGVIGMGIAWCGFEAIFDYRGTLDCFGRRLNVTCVNNVDALAAGATFIMGEGAEQTPVAIITGAPRIQFQDRPPNDAEIELFQINPKEDLYASLLRGMINNTQLF